jgi:hypothetical protein
MDEQRTPDELGTENEAICETLLGWKRSSIVGYWFPSPCHVGTLKTPAFDTWADAGLILDALDAKNIGVEVGNFANFEEHWYCDFEGMALPTPKGRTAPLAIRACAIEYIRSLP